MALLFVVLCAAFAGLFIHLRSGEKSDASQTAALTWKGLAADSVIESSVEGSSGFHALVAGTEGFDWPQGYHASQPYRLSSTVKTGWGDYYDLSFTIRPDGTLSVLADGFSPYDRISLSIDGHSSFRNIPLDWSGRLELTAALDKSRSGLACVNIDGEKIAVGVCHRIAGGSAA